jgi:hypothetical protein
VTDRLTVEGFIKAAILFDDEDDMLKDRDIRLSGFCRTLDFSGLSGPGRPGKTGKGKQR